MQQTEETTDLGESPSINDDRYQQHEVIDLSETH